MLTKDFPDIIRNLPRTNIGVQGVDAWLLQGENQQMVFMDFHEDVEVPEHSHEAQWCAVLDGTMELTLKEQAVVLTKGDSYFIREGAPHSARIRKGYKDVTLFNQKDRYSLA
jgi:quercetin dioxygenase-like cupin family protein